MRALNNHLPCPRTFSTGQMVGQGCFQVTPGSQLITNTSGRSWELHRALLVRRPRHSKAAQKTVRQKVWVLEPEYSRIVWTKALFHSNKIGLRALF